MLVAHNVLTFWRDTRLRDDHRDRWFHHHKVELRGLMRLWIRADGSATRGLGHIMRTIAVAEAVRSAGGDSRYVVVDDAVAPKLLIQRGLEVDVIEAPHDEHWLERIVPSDLVLFDGYHFGPDDYQNARGAGARVGAVDDFGSGCFPVDVLLNQNPVSTPDYQTLPETVVLLGARYALVCREFRALRRRRAGGAGTLVVTFGGSDAAGATGSAILAIAGRAAFKEVIVILGPSARRTHEPLPAGVTL